LLNSSFLPQQWPKLSPVGYSTHLAYLWKNGQAELAWVD